MKTARFLLLGMIAVALAAPQDKPAEKEKKAEPRVLKVKLDYSGSGVVDARHPIYVFLFDSPDFVKGAGMPIGDAAATAKDQTVTISGVAAGTVYAVAAYDPQGAYDGQSGPPPSGSSMGMYNKTPGTPEPIKIEPGQTVTIELPFDDSHKMP